MRRNNQYIPLMSLDDAIELYKLESERLNSTYRGFRSLRPEIRELLISNGVSKPEKMMIKIAAKNPPKGYMVYRDLVDRLSSGNMDHLDLSNRKFIGGDHVDHIVPVKYCYLNKIDPYVCARAENLQILSHYANFDKGDVITDEGRRLIDKWIEEGVVPPYPHKDVKVRPNYLMRKNRFCKMTTNIQNKLCLLNTLG